MKQQAMFPKVATDMFLVQSLWTGGFLGIILLVNIVKTIIVGVRGNEVEGFFSSIFIAGNIFMLVIGILSIYFLPHFVGNGVTRKDYFIGTVLASIGLSIIIPIITTVLSVLEKFILHFVNIDYKVQTMNEVDMDGNFIGDVVKSIIVTPYVDPEINWILAICVFSLNIFLFYLMGWFISSCFYRFDIGAGLISILIAMVLIMIKDTLLRSSLELPVFGWFSALDVLPLGIALIGILFIILITIWFIRIITKRVAIKM